MDSSLAHIVSQTRQNVEFLIAQRHISPEDGRGILRSMAALEQQAQNPLISPPPSRNLASYSQPPALPQSQIVQAKALWSYSEGQNENDLSFRAGDTIEIIEETNPDWWTGRHQGRQGLFPSNYVEKLAPPPPSPYQPRDAYPNNSSFPSQPAPYQPPPGAYSGPGYQSPSPGGPGGYQPMYQPPPGPPQMGGPYNSYGGPPPVAPPPPPPPQAAAPPEQPPKKGKLGNLGNTLVQSAVGGVGFGAGSAVGNGIIHSIF